MDVKTFVAEVLQEIVEGVREAQKMEGGGCINARSSTNSSGNIVQGGATGTFTRVDFDMGVAAESSGGGKGKLQVWGLGGLEGGGEHKRSASNRVVFSVLVRLPEGDATRR